MPSLAPNSAAKTLAKAFTPAPPVWVSVQSMSNNTKRIMSSTLQQPAGIIHKLGRHFRSVCILDRQILSRRAGEDQARLILQIGPGLEHFFFSVASQFTRRYQLFPRPGRTQEPHGQF